MIPGPCVMPDGGSRCCQESSFGVDDDDVVGGRGFWQRKGKQTPREGTSAPAVHKTSAEDGSSIRTTSRERGYESLAHEDRQSCCCSCSPFCADGRRCLQLLLPLNSSEP